MRKLLTLMALVTLSTTAAAQIFVSPRGSDQATGTAARPLRSIQQAVELAKSRNSSDTTTIYLYGGRYDLTETVEIQHANKLIIKPAVGEKVTITGSRSINPQLARAISDPALRTAVVAANVRQIDMSKLGITLSPIHAVGFGRPSVPCWNELFIDGLPGHLSRYPNDTVMMIGKIHNTGDIPRENITGRGNPTFEYSDPRVNTWSNTRVGWISGYFAHGYADDMIPVSSIDTLNKTLTAAMPTRYGFMTDAPWRTWFAVNIPTEIDLQGEYAIDTEANILYFKADGAKELNLSVLEGPMIAVEKSRGVRIEGLTFEHSRGIGVYIANSHDTEIRGCTLRYLGNWGVCIGEGAGLVHQSTPTAKEKRIVGDMDGRLYDNTLLNRNAGTNNGVRDCYIYGTGSGGVLLSGGDRATLTPAGNYVENCVIRDFNRIEKSYKGAVNIDGVGNRISKVDISGAPSMAILIHGNDHIIEYCKITDVCREIDDQGAVYYGRDPSERGLIVRYNYFKDLSPRHRVSATYHDDGACGMRVEGNIYLRAGSGPVLIGGGHDNHYKNNIFIDCRQAFHIDNRMQTWGKGMVARGGVIDDRLQVVKHTEPPYSTAYPELANYWNEDPSQPKRNIIEGNLCIDVRNFLSGQTQWGEFHNNFSTMSNPGFADLSDPLKGFVKGAEVFEKIKNFPNLPFENIGCTLPVIE